jgi:glycosyltransferase involved in cell wall biosynthesis
MAERYESLGVPHVNLPEVASFRPAERKNVVAYAIYLWKSRRLPQVVGRLRPLIAAYDVRLIHVNHESLALFGRLLAQRLDLPWVCHVRTLLIPGRFARFVYGAIARDARHVFLISEQNRDHFASLVGPRFDPRKASVVYNIAPLPEPHLSALPDLLDPPGVFRVLSLTNFSPNRGVDRILDVAAELKRRGREDFVFYLCGQLANVRRLPGARNRYLESMMTHVQGDGLGQMVRFPGHTERPDRALATCDALIKLTRESNPWGRDIVEALAAGLPVVTLGTFQGFVEDGVNGFMDPEFDSARVADHLIQLSGQAGLKARMTEANRAKARRMFDGPARAADVAAVYQEVLGACG